VLLRVTLIAAAFLLVVGYVNASTLITDAARIGHVIDPRQPFFLEYTSILVIIALIPFIALCERWFPIVPEGWAGTVAFHLAASIVYCCLHLAGMILLRKAVFWLWLGQPYVFFDDPVTDFVYEYRKDALTYGIAVLLFTLVRGLEEHRREAQRARAEARETGRLTLKSGGRTVLLGASSVEWAQAAGNYVEVRASGRTHLVRIGLAALEEQLAAAGIDVARIHRSFIVNRAKLIEITPIGDGDFKVKTEDGSELRGSRRYRQNLPA
jgi:hypothetical protein